MDNMPESSLLYAARNGDVETVKSLVTAQKQNGLLFDLNCTGMYKYICILYQNMLTFFRAYIEYSFCVQIICF